MTRPAAAAALAVLTILGSSPPAFAQASDEMQTLRKDIETLKAGVAEIRKDVQEIKRLLQARPAAQAAPPQEVVVNLDGAPAKGVKTARVTLVEFTDYQ